MAAEQILIEAEFNRKVRTYWLLSGAIILTVTVIGIVLLPVWFVVGNFFTERYLERMKCTLTTRSLKVSKGLFVRVEKTIPLDKITDLGLVQGPIMRALDIEAVSVETAGQSSEGSSVSLTGIVDGRAFRDAVLRQRDAIVAREIEPPRGDALAASHLSGDSANVLGEIRDTLLRIEQAIASERLKS